MKTLLLGFIMGVTVGAFAVWYYQGESARQTVPETRTSVPAAADRAKVAIQERISDIRTEDIKRELESAGMVVRDKIKRAGETIFDATADARTTATIKGKLLKEPGLSSLNISVDTTDGLVTLSGTAHSHEEVAKAVKIALETEGVRKVVSTLQVKPSK